MDLILGVWSISWLCPTPFGICGRSFLDSAVIPERSKSGGEMDVDAVDDDTNSVDGQPDAAEPEAATDVEMEDLDAHTGQDEPPTILPERAPKPKPRPARGQQQTRCQMRAQQLPRRWHFLQMMMMMSLLWVSPGSRSQRPNIQQLKNQVTQFMEYATPRPFNSAHFIISEGGVDWTRGRPPLSGKARSLRVIESLASMLQGEEDHNKNDFDYGGTSRYLGKDEKPHLNASLIDNGT